MSSRVAERVSSAASSVSSRDSSAADSASGAGERLLSDEQAAYIGVTPEGPFKPEPYRY